MHSAIMPTNGLLTKISLIFLVSIIAGNIGTVESDLIILNLKHTSSQDNREFKLCALKKPLANIVDNNIEYNFVNLKNEDGCRPLQQPVDPAFNRSAVYIHTPKTNCPFPKTIENLQVYSPKLVLVGSDGPIVYKLTQILNPFLEAK
jgi:hypothetical protein